MPDITSKRQKKDTVGQSVRTKKGTKRKKDLEKDKDKEEKSEKNHKKDKDHERERGDVFTPEAKDAMRKFAQAVTMNGVHALRIQYNDLRAFVPADPSKTAFDANPNKNRYKDVFCWDKTRVILKWPPGIPGDYLHANWVSHPLLEYQFICCQGPLDSTVGDFWRSVWQEKVKQIIMLCRCQELGKDKCAQYWPLNVGDAMTHFGLQIKCDKVDTTDRSFIHTKLLLTFKEETRNVDHRQLVVWPDKSVPKTPLAPFRLLQYIRKYPKNPCIIHCSAGIGRTGTLVLIDMIYKSLLQGKIPDVPNLVKELRTARALAVQTEDQYVYVHYSVLQLLHVKSAANAHYTRHFNKEYENYIKLLSDNGGKNLPPQATVPPTPCGKCLKVAACADTSKDHGSPPTVDNDSKRDNVKEKEEKKEKEKEKDKDKDKEKEKEKEEKKEERKKDKEERKEEKKEKRRKEDLNVSDSSKRERRRDKHQDKDDDLDRKANLLKKLKDKNREKEKEKEKDADKDKDEKKEKEHKKDDKEKEEKKEKRDKDKRSTLRKKKKLRSHDEEPEKKKEEQFEQPPPTMSVPMVLQATPVASPAVNHTADTAVQAEHDHFDPKNFDSPHEEAKAPDDAAMTGLPLPVTNATPEAAPPLVNAEATPPAPVGAAPPTPVGAVGAGTAAAASKGPFQYKPAVTYTIQTAGGKKAIVYHRNQNQPFIKAIAAPPGQVQPQVLLNAGATPPPPPQPSQAPQPPQN